ncbi:hypothetical protein OH76DRAFT_1490424 [Lentinus brumalis]|uniref:Uncharacterized protein n=1 Tax=Lentinus brumalis TaxID=2498619 RepID=A0A371CJ19_9APHY|nr:hypothetical protein OH76DRAFT_1490424 [Polyporus brumalis]
MACDSLYVWGIDPFLMFSSGFCDRCIVEDFDSEGSLVAFAKFDTVTFTGASATSNSGSTVGPAGASVIDIHFELKCDR